LSLYKITFYPELDGSEFAYINGYASTLPVIRTYTLTSPAVTSKAWVIVHCC